MTSGPAAAIPVRAIAFLSLAAFGSAAALRVTDAMLPQLAREFAVTTGAAGHVVTAFAISYGLLQLVFAPLAERFGKYAVVAASALASAAGSLVCAAAPTLEALAAARFLAGAVAGALIPISIAFIGDTVPYASRQPVLARFLMGQMLGIAGGQALGGWVGERFGWRVPFLALAALFLAAAVCLIAEWHANPATRPATRRPAEGGLLVSVRRVLARPWARVVLAGCFIEGFAIYGPFAFIAAYLHERFGVSLAAAGGMIAFFGLGGMLYALAAAPLVARLRERGLVVAGAVALLAGYVALAFAPAAWMAIPSSLLIGLGFYMIHNTLQVNATQMAPETRGTGMALFATCFFTGQSLGVAAVAVAVDTVGARPAFLVSAAALLAFAAWFRAQLARRGSGAP
jgi:predicted MFS family arabinose efflux permease